MNIYIYIIYIYFECFVSFVVYVFGFLRFFGGRGREEGGQGFWFWDPPKGQEALKNLCRSMRLGFLLIG